MPRPSSPRSDRSVAPPASRSSRRAGGAPRLVLAAGLALLLARTSAAECDGFIEWVADPVARYHAAHRVHPVDDEVRALAARWLPHLWIHPDSHRPIDFDEYLAEGSLRSESGELISEAPDAALLASLSRDEQCATYLEAPELPAADPAPVYVQAFRDVGPAAAADAEPDWLYLKYTFVFDWSGLAERRSLLSRLGSLLTGGRPERWHRLDVHTSAILGLDPQRALRTVTLQQHNNKRSYVAGVDFDPALGVHVAAARGTNELYLDDGSSDPQERRAVVGFVAWKHLVSADFGTTLWQVDTFTGRNAGGLEVRLRPVFPAPDYPLASFAGLLAPPRRLLGFYVGRDGPPGYDFTGFPEMPVATTMGYWHEGDETLLEVLDQHLDGFRSSNWEAIRAYLATRLAEALRTGSR